MPRAGRLRRTSARADVTDRDHHVVDASLDVVHDDTAPYLVLAAYHDGDGDGDGDRTSGRHPCRTDAYHAVPQLCRRTRRRCRAAPPG